MIWVFGDVHGLYDPLNYLIQKIKARESQGEAVERVIFLGDLIDHGPSSREVVDLVQNLPWPFTVLLGNHEDMMLRHHQGLDCGWIPQNGGQHTLASWHSATGLPDSVVSWFKTRPISYSRRFILPSGPLELNFVHAGFLPEVSLAEQLEISSFSGLHAWLEAHDLPLTKSPLWTRRPPVRTAPGTITLCGHTPTQALGSVLPKLEPYQADSNTPWLGFDTPPSGFMVHQSRQEIFWGAPLEALHTINLDTGAVYGGNLSALGLSEGFLTRGELPLLSVPTGRGYRSSPTTDWTLRFSRTPIPAV